jgi:valyl-tRNA synthetase
VVPVYYWYYFVVATTRPETMLGDTGVAVHPDDERYVALVKAGAKVKLPLVGREIPIVADEYSDPEKGTGAVKITPAHDFNDFEVGKRHDFPQINVLDAYGKINDEAPESYRKLDRFEARKKVVSDIDALGLLEKIEPTSHTVPHGDRSGAVVEPWLTDQWYVNAAELAKPAIAAVESGKSVFVPKNWEKTYFEWMRNIQPWCISRQLWWGHQIPAWYHLPITESGKAVFDLDAINAPLRGGTRDFSQFPYVVATTEGEALKKISKKIPHKQLVIVGSQNEALLMTNQPGKAGVWRDEDVLDTWFSSALWPFSTLGWPDKTPELERYYPTSVLVTGFDIIFFWVARMMMMGLHFMDEVPFKDVYIHALVRDEKGQKMSKSKGNVMDPLVLIDDFGADALRFTLAAMAAQGRDIKLAKSRVEGYRNFATKLWNAARFAEMNECVRQRNFDPKSASQTFNKWIIGEAELTAKAVTAALEAYRFNDAANAIYEFVWGQFCDWYLELIKPLLAGDDEAAKSETRAVAAWTLDQILKMLHPFMPFITEELWAHMVEYGVKRDDLLCLSQWPALDGLVERDAVDEVNWLVTLISEIRSVRTEMSVPAGAKIPLVIVAADEAIRRRVRHNDETLKRLARLDAIDFAKSAPKGAALIVAGETTAALPLAGIIDMGAEKRRLAKEIEKAEGDLKKMDAKLSNPQFMERAKEEAIEEAQERKAELETEIKRFSAALKRLSDAA